MVGRRASQRSLVPAELRHPSAAPLVATPEVAGGTRHGQLRRTRIGAVNSQAEPIGRLAPQHGHRRSAVVDQDRAVGPTDIGKRLIREGITLVHLATIRPADTIGSVEASTDPGEETTASVMPIGRSGRLEAMPLTAAGDHALLIREADPTHRGRALLTTDKLPSGERLVVMPLDDDVEVRVDGDALAVWLGSGSLGHVPPQHVALDESRVPPWATVVGGALLLLVLAFAVIGSAVAFSWLMRLLG